MKTYRRARWLLGVSLAALAAFATPAAAVEDGGSAYPSTYKPLASQTTLITNVNIYDGAGGLIENGAVLMENNTIAAIGQNLAAPDGAVVVDGAGKWVTPGIIDIHSHLGVYASPTVNAQSDGNELTNPNTAEVWSEHAIWPQDPQFERALAGGVTVLEILPGSGNLFGGRAVTVKNVPAVTYQAMKFPGAPQGLKMACGENPKRVYGNRTQFPSTLMGDVAGYRKGWAAAVDYKREWDAYDAKIKKGEEAAPPKRDLALDTLAAVLEGKILVQMHCYRADEMATMIDVMKEFGYHIAAFHHAIESYKIADLLAANGICSGMWTDWWGFKMEAFDTVRENIPLVHAAGACAIVHSDSAIGIQRLNQEAAKALAHGRRTGINISKAEAWEWLSLNPAKALGIDKVTGSLAPGKNADVVVWTADPFSVYARAEKVYIDGALVFDENDPGHQPVSDFRLGLAGEGDPK
jgi:imidazolonepropionase-like amidohydrolase